MLVVYLLAVWGAFCILVAIGFSIYELRNKKANLKSKQAIHPLPVGWNLMHDYRAWRIVEIHKTENVDGYIYGCVGLVPYTHDSEKILISSWAFVSEGGKWEVAVWNPANTQKG